MSQDIFKLPDGGAIWTENQGEPLMSLHWPTLISSAYAAFDRAGLLTGPAARGETLRTDLPHASNQWGATRHYGEDLWERLLSDLQGFPAETTYAVLMFGHIRTGFSLEYNHNGEWFPDSHCAGHIKLVVATANLDRAEAVRLITSTGTPGAVAAAANALDVLRLPHAANA